MLNLSIDNMFIETIGIPMGTHGAVLFADLKVNSTTYTEKSASNSQLCYAMQRYQMVE
jgi:hypothetical protein